MHLSEQGWKALFALEISETCHTNQLSLFDCNIGMLLTMPQKLGEQINVKIVVCSKVHTKLGRYPLSTYRML